MSSPAGPFSDGGDQELGRLLDRFQQDVAAIERLSEQMTAVKGRGEAAQGRVTVEVTSAGALSGLVIDPRAMRLGSAELAAAILEASARAARDAARAADDLVAPFIAGTVLEDAGPRGRDAPQEGAAGRDGGARRR
ncbi:YbaB/EbfC family nucleoid-associated protein [Nonomuraea sp. NPDC050783]|uniref:YbaB/EbfC family nucleoid-associated protein n=1 Tax=Nonomuraea sp. NPDC050783 TaxID=3154634 RepID=UPI003465D148